MFKGQEHDYLCIRSSFVECYHTKERKTGTLHDSSVTVAAELYKLVVDNVHAIGHADHGPRVLQERADMLHGITASPVPRRDCRTELLYPKGTLLRCGQFVAPMENLVVMYKQEIDQKKYKTDDVLAALTDKCSVLALLQLARAKWSWVQMGSQSRLLVPLFISCKYTFRYPTRI